MKKNYIKFGMVIFSFLLVLTINACSGFEEQLIYNDAQRAHNKKDFETAIRLYCQLLDEDPQDKIHPDNAIIRYDLGVAYIDSKQCSKAKDQIRILKKNKENDLAKELEKLMTISDNCFKEM